MDQQALETKHGPVRVFTCPLGSIAFKAPSLHEWERFQDGVMGGKLGQSSRILCMSCVAEVEGSTAEAIFAKYPAAITAFAQACKELAGADAVVEEKKS